MSSPGPKIALVLTATINPGQTPMLVCRDPKERLADYHGALRAWLNSPLKVPIVMCENSGADLTPLQVETGRDFELIGYRGNHAAQSKGKGAGEAEILRHVLAESKTAADADLVLKVSGRYYVSNIEPLVRRTLALGDADCYLDLWWYLQVCDSDVFMATPDFLWNYFLPRADLIDDPAGHYLEHSLTQAVHASIADGGKWLPLGLAPNLEGTSGTFGWPMADKLPRRVASRVRRHLALQVLCHGPRGRFRRRD